MNKKTIKAKFKLVLIKISGNIISAVIFTLAAVMTVYVYAAFQEPSVGPASSDQDFTQNILGANDGNNDFDSSAVVANTDGSIIERQQYLEDQIFEICGGGIPTVLIGSQTWMQYNMNVGTQLANGNTAPSNDSIIEKWCPAPTGTAGTVDNLQYAANCTTDGGLYQWAEAMALPNTCNSTTCVGSVNTPHQGICPSGFHIPTDVELDTLDRYLATGTCNAARSNAWDCDPAGTKLKVGGTSGFEGLLAGYRGTDGSFSNRTAYTFLWSSTESGTSAWIRYLNSGYSTVYRYADAKAYGFSVRCLKN